MLKLPLENPRRKIPICIDTLEFRAFRIVGDPQVTGLKSYTTECRPTFVAYVPVYDIREDENSIESTFCLVNAGTNIFKSHDDPDEIYRGLLKLKLKDTEKLISSYRVLNNTNITAAHMAIDFSYCKSSNECDVSIADISYYVEDSVVEYFIKIAIENFNRYTKDDAMFTVWVDKKSTPKYALYESILKKMGFKHSKEYNNWYNKLTPNIDCSVKQISTMYDDLFDD